jgi:ubiquinone/menaquinone biosynthesis C-methylase UbiE
VLEAIVCESCCATFDVVWGAPFLGHYQAEDIPGLLEIAANARADNVYAGREDVERIEGLLHRYHEASDRSQFLAACGDDFAHAPWFAHRYTEYSAFYALSKNINFADRDVLDVGAGTGYDAWRLVEAGGRVTAFEYNPVLIRRGRSVVPEARWIGGLAHVLPFGSETFDIVCCNAALHHMRDVPAAMQEMLRVLRPGGWLLTTGDPFRADDSGDETELDVFDNHPDFLLGVNESIPRFGELAETLVSSQDRITARFLTTSISEGGKRRRLLALARRRNPRENREWSFRKRKRLSTVSGSLAIKVHVRKPLPLLGKTQGSTVLRAGDYARVLDNYEDALAKLAPLLPSAFVDSAFPGERQTKFELLNGWQKPEPGREFRCAYKRARWFLTRPEHSQTLRFCARKGSASRVVSSLQVRIGAVLVGIPLGDEWSEALVSVSHVPLRTRFVCELHVIPAEIDDLGFDDYCFAVKDRCFI